MPTTSSELLILNSVGFYPFLPPISGYNPEMAEWMTLRDVADYLSIPPSTVYKLKARGKIRGYRVGRNLRFDRVEVDADVKRTNSKASPKEKKARKRK